MKHDWFLSAGWSSLYNFTQLLFSAKATCLTEGMENLCPKTQLLRIYLEARAAPNTAVETQGYLLFAENYHVGNYQLATPVLYIPGLGDVLAA